MCTTVELPSKTKIFKHQIAGHFHGQGKTKLGVLEHEDGSILKPIDPRDVRSARELQFYQSVFTDNCMDIHLSELRNYIPKFFGVWHSENSLDYMKIENLARDYHNPSILDIKIGARTFDPEASVQKQQVEKMKYPSASVLGFRVLGMKVYQESTSDYMLYDREFGKKQTQDTILTALHKYFNEKRGHYVQRTIENFLSSLRNLHSWFLQQEKLCFYSSSLLFLYSPLESDTEPSCDVRMIDFAHVFVNQGHDENYLFGLENLIKYFQKLLTVVTLI